ncbi:MAG: hypothetical protein EOP34_00605 [Rickettsiales bacterium]|nr:MAG: hypothetical protein EOP34_00605 [Rickettsiales bacterium]
MRGALSIMQQKCGTIQETLDNIGTIKETSYFYVSINALEVVYLGTEGPNDVLCHDSFRSLVSQLHHIFRGYADYLHLKINRNGDLFDEWSMKQATGMALRFLVVACVTTLAMYGIQGPPPSIYEAMHS